MVASVFEQKGGSGTMDFFVFVSVVKREDFFLDFQSPLNLLLISTATNLFFFPSFFHLLSNFLNYTETIKI